MRYNKNNFKDKPYLRKWDEPCDNDERYDPTIIAAMNLRYEEPLLFE